MYGYTENLVWGSMYTADHQKNQFQSRIRSHFRKRFLTENRAKIELFYEKPKDENLLELSLYKAKNY
jgi:hypothetical protein